MVKKKKRQYALKRDFTEFGEYLKEMRLAAELTQGAVARELAYSSAQFISNFERGISLPPLAKLKVLMKLYKMPKAEVIEKITDARTKILNERL